MKNSVLNYGFICLLSAVFYSCQKLAKVKLDAASQAYVIEGVITDQPSDCKVFISQTKAFGDNNAFIGISGATVTIENKGLVVPLQEVKKGVYSTNAITGLSGQTYKLNVNIEGHLFTASSTMPKAVAPEKIYAEKENIGKNKFITVVYQDPPETDNYYRWVQYVNQKKELTIFAANDEFNNGTRASNVLNFRNDISPDLEVGDTVRIDMLSIDAAVYKYWASLRQTGSGSGVSASPSNPVSNIQGGCLGYFSAHTLRKSDPLIIK